MRKIKLDGSTRLILMVVFILIIIMVAELLGVREQFTIEKIRNIFNQNILISSLIFTGLFLVASIIQIPGFVFLTAATVTLGRNEGFLLTYFAAICAGIFNFYFVKLLGGDALQEIKSKWVQKCLIKINENPIKIMCLLRVFLQIAPPLNYALALSGVRLRDYILGIIIGLPIPYYLYTFVIDEISKQIL